MSSSYSAPTIHTMSGATVPHVDRNDTGGHAPELIDSRRKRPSARVVEGSPAFSQTIVKQRGIAVMYP